MNDDELIAAIQERIAKMDDYQRQAFFEEVRDDKYCSNCWGVTNGGTCWGCYESRPYD